jgi:hypothetical protein
VVLDGRPQMRSNIRTTASVVIERQRSAVRKPLDPVVSGELRCSPPIITPLDTIPTRCQRSHGHRSGSTSPSRFELRSDAPAVAVGLLEGHNSVDPRHNDGPQSAQKGRIQCSDARL